VGGGSPECERPARAAGILPGIQRSSGIQSHRRRLSTIFDAGLYDAIARNLINRHCYCIYGSNVTVSRAPLWPGIIAAIYAVFGQDNLYARLFLCLLGAGTCVIVYRFARDLFGARTGLLAGVIAAVYTGLFLYDGWLYTEALYTFCVTGFTYALYRVQVGGQSRAGRCVEARIPLRRRLWQVIAQRRWEVVCGLLIGAATLTRPNGLVLIGIVALWAVIVLWAQRWPLPETLRSVVLIAVLAVAFVAPWTVRNYVVAHAFIPVETGLGEVLLGSYNDGVTGGGPGPLGNWLPPQGALNHDNVRYTPAMYREDTLHALSWMTAHPAHVPYLWALHLGQMWLPYTPSYGLPIEEYRHRLSSRVVWTLINLESVPIFLLAATGLLLTWRRRKGE
jgi:4-amino-4-deoxy-L-arabinose transferase-like glycosyltransferase